MTKLTTSVAREIVEDFAKEIDVKKSMGSKPAKAVIDFRMDKKNNVERKIYDVPLDLLRYRKDNGRISSDVLSHEINIGRIDEKSVEGQALLRKFLEDKDREKTEELIRIIKHDGQREPAIITCDGFLINGNRRKMVLEFLQKESKKDQTLRVVILPGNGDEGGPPSLKEIEIVEDKYQAQSDGKAEYYSFETALSKRRKIMESGYTLEEQLRNDPNYADLPDKKFKKALKVFDDMYLKPLECVDRYLEFTDRPGVYDVISAAKGDPEGRWQAFMDFHNSVSKPIRNEKKRIQNNINENEVGIIEDVAFKIIRQRDLKGIDKVHIVMRDLVKWINNKDSKKELFKINKEVDHNLTDKESSDKEGNEYDPREIDRIWANKNAPTIINSVKKAKAYFEHKKERETPITLLEGAKKKLEHDDMDTSTVALDDLKKAMKLAREIGECASTLENEFFQHEKELKKLIKKK